MPRKKKELVDEEILGEEILEEKELLEETQVEEIQESEGKVLFISKGSVLLSYLVNGVECGISIPLNEKYKNVKPGDLIKF